MSTIAFFAIHPADKGESLSPYVARAMKVIKESGLPYMLNPMGTAVEGEWDDIMALITRCKEEMETDCDRIFANMKLDYRKGRENGLAKKMQAVKDKM